MIRKKRVNITLSQEAINRTEELKLKYGCNSLSALFEVMINKDITQNQIANDVVEQIENKYKNLFTRMRLGINDADRNSQVMLEVLNSWAYYNKFGTMLTSVEETQVIKDSKEEIKRKIALYKQNKDWKNHK